MGEKKKAQSVVKAKFEVDMSEVPTYDEQLMLMNKKLESQRLRIKEHDKKVKEKKALKFDVSKIRRFILFL